MSLDCPGEGRGCRCACRGCKFACGAHDPSDTWDDESAPIACPLGIPPWEPAGPLYAWIGYVRHTPRRHLDDVRIEPLARQVEDVVWTDPHGTR